MTIAILCTGMMITFALFAIANSIKELAHEVYVHAEVMTDMKHQGNRCDDLTENEIAAMN